MTHDHLKLRWVPHVRILDHDLLLLLVQGIDLVVKNLLGTFIVLQRLLVISQYLFHSRELLTVSDIDSEDEGVDANQLLVQTQCGLSHKHGDILEPANHCLEQLHVTVGRDQVLLGETRESLDDFLATECRLVHEPLEK